MPIRSLTLPPAAVVAGTAWLTARKSRHLLQQGGDGRVRCDTRLEGELHSVIVIHRHGHRTPIITFPGQPAPGTPEYDKLWGRCPAMPKLSQGKDFFLPLGPASAMLEPCKTGSLTELGQAQLLDLGTYLRKRYTLGDALFQDDVHVRSTESDRAVLSATTLLQGLCPGLARDEALALVKLPHLGSRLHETMWATQAPCQHACPRLAELVEEVRCRATASPFKVRGDIILDAIMKKEGAVLQDHMKNAHWLPHPPGLGALAIFNDTAACLQAKGAIELPGSLSREVLEEVEDKVFKEWLAGIELLSLEGAYLSGGRLVADVQQNIQKVISAAGKTPQPQLYIFSGHDVSIVSFLSAIGKPPSSCPGFASSTLIELWRDFVRGWHIRVVYFPSSPHSVDAHDEAAGGQVLLSVPLEEWNSRIAPALDVAANFQERCRPQKSSR